MVCREEARTTAPRAASEFRDKKLCEFQLHTPQAVSVGELCVDYAIVPVWFARFAVRARSELGLTCERKTRRGQSLLGEQPVIFVS